jgi:hypothetical protein
MLHYGRDEGVCAVGNGVRLALDGVFQELVDQNEIGRASCRERVSIDV